MASVKILTLIEAEGVGGETVRVESDQSQTLTSGATWTNTRIIADDDADGDVVLWDSTANGNPSTFLKMAVYVDPDEAQTAVLNLLVEVRVNTTVLVFTVNRQAPLIFAAQAADTAIPSSGAATSTINRVRVVNNNAAGSSGADLKVRIVLFG